MNRRKLIFSLGALIAAPAQALLDFRFWLITKLAGKHIVGVNLRVRGSIIIDHEGARQAFFANCTTGPAPEDLAPTLTGGDKKEETNG